MRNEGGKAISVTGRGQGTMTHGNDTRHSLHFWNDVVRMISASSAEWFLLGLPRLSREILIGPFALRMI